MSFIAAEGECGGFFKQRSGLTMLEVDTLFFEVRDDWQHNGVVLVVFRTIHSFQSVDSWEFLNESVKVTVEFNSAVP